MSLALNAGLASRKPHSAQITKAVAYHGQRLSFCPDGVGEYLFYGEMEGILFSGCGPAACATRPEPPCSMPLGLAFGAAHNAFWRFPYLSLDLTGPALHKTIRLYTARPLSKMDSGLLCVLGASSQGELDSASDSFTVSIADTE